MNELIDIKNDEAVTTSLQIAKVFGKRHADVLQKIENIINNDSTEKSVQCFKRSKYKDRSGKVNPMYYINRDGFVFLVMGFTGKKADEWRWKYIDAFNQMEEYIRFRKTDIQLQKNAMQFLQDNLDMPEKSDFRKANTIADKCVSNMYGYPKMIKKEEMTPEMLVDREPVLRDTVELMALNDKYKLGVSVSKNIYKKHAAVGG